MSNSAVEIDDFLSDLDSTDENVGEEDKKDGQESIKSEIAEASYNDEDLAKLVEFVQRMSILFTLDHRDWREEALDNIRRWLLEVNQPMLTIYYDCNRLTASLGFPISPVLDISYFVRAPSQIFTVDGFHDEVNFGTIHDDIDGCLLHVLQVVYAPIFRNLTNWNDTVKLRFNKALDKFLVYLTGLHYKMGGMTVLYVPYVVKQLARGNIAHDREFVKCLESITVYWLTQIRTLLNDRALVVPHDLVVVEDEYEFWLYRFEVLQGLNAQLKNHDVQRIIKVLRNAHSVYIKQIDEVLFECKFELETAMSNIKYLHLLVKPCAKIEIANSPSEVAQLLPHILHLIRFIWLKSEYYNRPELISSLFRNLSNQIIRFCTTKINIDKILSGNSRFGIKMCEMSIDCCLTYKSLYDQMAKDLAKRQPEIGWDLNHVIIFNHVDAFIERLKNVIDICESMIVFGRLDETQDIPRPRFGGTNGVEFEEIAKRVETQFLTSLSSLKTNSMSIILNVHKHEWYNVVQKYSQTIQNLEETIQLLITNVFQSVCNIEETLEALNVMLFYSHKGALRIAYLRQVSKMWLSFEQEMDNTVRTLRESSKVPRESWLPCNVFRATNYRINLERLQWLRDRLSSSVWLPVVPEARIVLGKFDCLSKEFAKETRKSFDSWTKKCGTTSLLPTLERPLLTRSKMKRGLLECNIDRSVLGICEEAHRFQQLGFNPPCPIRKLYEKYSTIKLVYESTLQVCLDYNRILLAMTEDERKLFRVLINACDRKIAPGLFKLNFSDELSDAYIADCALYTGNLQDTLNIYKRCNRLIARICEKICDTHMLKFTFSGAVTITVFEQQLSNYIRTTTNVLKGYYEAIIQFLSAVYREFEHIIRQMALEWFNYVNVFDNMLGTALLTSARNSLDLIYRSLCKEDDMTPAPILVVEADVFERAISLNPNIDTVANLLQGTIDRVVYILEQFPRLGNALDIPKSQQQEPFSKGFQNDPKCKDLMEKISHEIQHQRSEIQRHVDFWNGYKNVWQTTDEQFIEQIKKSAQTAAVFEKSIESYSVLADDISFVDTLAHVYFILINQNCIKSTILDWIEKWQSLNIKLLVDHAASLIANVYQYMDRNESCVMTVPRTLREAQQAKLFFEALIAEVPIKQHSYPSMLELFLVIAKYQVKIDENTRQQVSGFSGAWLGYLKTLADADEMLENNNANIKEVLTQQAEQFRVIFKEFSDKYYAKLHSGRKS